MHISESDSFIATLKAQGVSWELTKTDGIPTLSLWVNGTMSFDKATWLASQAQYHYDFPVHFHQLDSQSLSLLLFAPGTRNSPTQLDEYGTPVSQWVAAAMGLSEPLSSLGQGEVITDSEEAPTHVKGAYGFIWSRHSHFSSNKRSGKWCVVRSAEEIDDVWQAVKAAIAGGKLSAACVSTASQAKAYGSYVICVFTDDWLNITEVNHARELLRSFGVNEDIGYKRDIETARNVYSGPEEWIYRA